MPNSRFLDRLQSQKVLVSDGATGTNLQTRGLPLRTPSDVWVLDRPDQILALEKEFVAAGSDVILTCTFGASRIRLEASGLADRTEEINRKAVEVAFQAVKGTQTCVAGSIGPMGHLFAPVGPMTVEQASAAFTEQARLLSEAGVDALVIETQYDLVEAKTAVQAVRSVSDLPLIVSFSYDRGTRTMMGVSPTRMAKELESLDVNLLGINCGHSPEENLKSLQELKQVTHLPIWFKPNAGLPQAEMDGTAIYDLSPEAMGAMVTEWLANGARVVGGCCGTSPAHLAEIARAAHTAQVAS